MAITTGSRLSSYEIVGILGAGGMGEVYRAHDTKLNRDVAIKVLPEGYAADPERVARFHREAQAVAAINHSRIAAIYDFAESDGIKFLVLELVEGETLADRLRRGPMPVDDAIATGIQILEALEAAHERGICHRDLKPANIKLTGDGAVKVLDFGLAKSIETGASAPSMTQSPTLTVAGTLPGVILGTAGYMSPEQAKGYKADHRSDIFSFGCILFEMLTGRQAFDGESVSDILAGIIKSDVDLTLLPPRLNPRVAELLRRCLEKNPKKRWHAAADVRVELEAIAANTVQMPAQTDGASSTWRRGLAWIAGGMLLGTIAGATLTWIFKPNPALPVARFQLSLPEGQAFTNTGRHVIAVSPDGMSFAYVANSRLFLRSIDAIDARPIPGTESAIQGGGIVNPEFSPDGAFVAYWSLSDGAIRRISTAGGASSVVCTALNPHGMHWAGDQILYGEREGIYRVAAKGGQPELILPAPKDQLLSLPQLLPNGRVLYSMKEIAGSWEKGSVVIQAIGGPPTVIIKDASGARYLPTGHIAYGVAGVLMVVPFDLERGQMIGDAVPIIEGIRRAGMEGGGTGVAQFAFSTTGTLLYLPGPLTLSANGGFLALYDRNGLTTKLNLPQGNYNEPRVSPDGHAVAFDTDGGANTNVWIYELSGKTAARRLTDRGSNLHALWSPDGQYVLFQSDRDGDLAIFRQRADGSGAAERLTKPASGEAHVPQSYSRDGKSLIFTVRRGSTSELQVMTMADRKTSVIEGTDSVDSYTEGALSPDGAWLAFQRRATPTETRRVFLQPFPATKARYLVRDRPAGSPYWSPDGKSLTLNVGPGANEIIPVTTTPTVGFGEARQISRSGRSEPNPALARRNVDPLPNGQGLIVVSTINATADDPRLIVGLNWFDDIRRRAPAR